MFREMRRKKQQLTQKECLDILAAATHGVLAVHGDDGYPYAVPVSHIYEDGKICFHSAVVGHKIDAIGQNSKVSFCVIAQDEVMAKERTTAYISVIAFGKARIVEDEAGLRDIAEKIGRKFSADYPEECAAEIDDAIARDRMRCVEITIDHLTSKAGKEVLKKRRMEQAR